MSDHPTGPPIKPPHPLDRPGPETPAEMTDSLAQAAPVPTTSAPASPPPPSWSPESHAIEALSLTKRFGDHVAVKGINLAIPVGSFYGLLGPNGAGKSTTLAMVTGLLRPDAGNIRVNGMAVWPDPMAVKATVGVVPENLLLFERLSAREYLRYVGRFRGLDDATVEQRSEDLLTTLDLDVAGNKIIADFSQGMRKKISLAAALLHAPPLLILDEPFESVDPVSQRTIRHILDQVIAAGKTVVFSSHVMATVEELCDSVAIMDNGQVMAAGPMSEVTAGRRLDDVFAHTVGGVNRGPASLDWLA